MPAMPGHSERSIDLQQRLAAFMNEHIYPNEATFRRQVASGDRMLRVFEAMCARVKSRVAFGKALAEQGTVRADIAESRMEIEQARLLTLKAAHLMDTVGNKEARGEVAMIKVVVPRMALRVLDRAIQAHGGAGVSDAFGLASAWAHARTIRLADGPDEVHRDAIAKLELHKSS